MGARTPLYLMEAINSSIFPSSLRACWGLGSILPKGTIRIRGPETRADKKSTKWSSCLMVMVSGSPDLLIFGTLYDLLSDFSVLHGPDGMGSVGEDGLLVGGAFLELDALGNKGFKDEAAKDLADSSDHVLGDVGPFIMKGNKDAEDLEVGIGHLLDLVDRFQEETID